MKKIKLTLFLLLLLLMPLANAASKVLNIYIWSGYIPDSVIQKFEKESGINVNVSEYDSNETMVAKLRVSPKAGYDLVLPSSYVLQRMVRRGMLQKIDKSKLPNFKNLNKDLLNKSYDPHNQYSIPYLWGTTGLVVNPDYINPKSVQSWQDFWQPRFKNQLMMLDDVRDVFSMALLTLGYSVNDENPEHIKAAYLKLKQLLPNVKIFNSDIEQNIYIDEDATIGMGYSGDIYLSQQVNKKLRYIYPKEGFVIWADCLAIPKYAEHVDAAHKFLNFLMRPDIAKSITMQFGYSTPNKAAFKLLPKNIRDNKVIYPDHQTMLRGQFQNAVSDKALVLYHKYWEKLKISG